jgi:hypothetical protein
LLEKKTIVFHAYLFVCFFLQDDEDDEDDEEDSSSSSSSDEDEDEQEDEQVLFEVKLKKEGSDKSIGLWCMAVSNETRKKCHCFFDLFVSCAGS